MIFKIGAFPSERTGRRKDYRRFCRLCIKIPAVCSHVTYNHSRRDIRNPHLWWGRTLDFGRKMPSVHHSLVHRGMSCACNPQRQTYRYTVRR